MMNCYSRGYIEDCLDDIMQANADIAKTFKAQGGQGLSLSKIRPKNCDINDGQYKSDGIVPFMRIFNETTSSISQGGCIAQDEYIVTHSGYKKIKDIKKGDFVWTKCGFKEVKDVICKGEQDVYSIVTDKGYSIKTTKDHKFCYDGFNKKPIDTFNVGENINLIASKAPKEIESLDSKSYLLASYFSNGYINKFGNGGSIRTGNKSVAERIYNTFLSEGVETKLNKLENVFEITLNKNACDFVKSLGGEKNTCRHISIPDYIMCGDDRTVLSFLAGLIDNDGCFKDNNTFQYDTVCKHFAEQVHLLFVRIGYLPSIQKTDRSDEGKSDIYRVCHVVKQCDVIIPSVKVDNVVPAKNSRYSTPYTMNNSNICDSQAEHLKKIGKDDNIGLYTYLKVKDKPFAPMIFDKIKSIESVGQDVVYDIVLNEEHLFSCNGIYVSNSRKGALIMTLDITHKEADKFITIKTQDGMITKANLSLEINDEFMNVIERYRNDEIDEDYKIHILRTYGDKDYEYDIYPVKLFKLIAQSAWEWAEPGCIFVDQFRNYNLMECQTNYNIETCNPCSEQPLPKHGACCLGSINLSEFVESPFSDNASFDCDDFKNAVRIGVRALNDIVCENLENHALESQRDMSETFRNIGLGVMGTYDMLVKLNIKYGSKECIELLDKIFLDMIQTAYDESCLLGSKYGAFKGYQKDNFMKSVFYKENKLHTVGLYEDSQSPRNCSLLSIAPTGSIAQMLNVSSGVEPAYALSYRRKTESLCGEGDKYYDVDIGIVQEYKNIFGEDAKLPNIFVTARDIPWNERIDVQAVMQKHIDTAISSTLNLPNSATQQDVEDIYYTAWKMGLKGVTVYRDGCKRAGILSTEANDDTKTKSSKQTEPEKQNVKPITTPKNAIGKKRKISTGCGRTHVIAMFDPNDGRLCEVYLGKGSTGGCNNYMNGLARFISLSARSGVSITTILDQLQSTGVCPSYAVATAKTHNTSKGSCCPMAIGNALLEMYLEMQDEIDKGMYWETVSYDDEEEQTTEEVLNPEGGICPECGTRGLIAEGGCFSCRNCGYSKCG